MCNPTYVPVVSSGSVEGRAFEVTDEMKKERRKQYVDSGPSTLRTPAYQSSKRLSLTVSYTRMSCLAHVLAVRVTTGTTRAARRGMRRPRARG